MEKMQSFTLLQVTHNLALAIVVLVARAAAQIYAVKCFT
jgi:hypothetical protein